MIINSTHLIKNPDFKSSKNLVQEKFRKGKSRNDLCLIKFEHNDQTKAQINNQNFPNIPCRMKKPLEDKAIDEKVNIVNVINDIERFLSFMDLYVGSQAMVHKMVLERVYLAKKNLLDYTT